MCPIENYYDFASMAFSKTAFGLKKKTFNFY